MLFEPGIGRFTDTAYGCRQDRRHGNNEVHPVEPWLLCALPARRSEKYVHMADTTNSTNETIRWYALKVFYGRVLSVKAELEAAGITTYVAMTAVEKFEDGKLTYIEKPLVASLLFLRCTETFLRELKQRRNADLMYYQDFATKKPAPIDETEMRSFIILTTVDRGTRVQYLGESVPDFKRGEHVRVTDGIYKGAEGYIKKVRSDRKLIVEVKGVAVVAVSYIHPALLEKILD